MTKPHQSFALALGFLLVVIPVVGKANPTVIISGPTNSGVYSVFLYSIIIYDAFGYPSPPGGIRYTIVSLTNATETIPLQQFYYSEVASIWGTYDVIVPPDVPAKQYTLTWRDASTVHSTPVYVGSAQFTTLPPVHQTAFVGTNITLTSAAQGATGYYWQKDGTNLVENSHYVGVSNATLTLSGTDVSDTGTYTVVAANPCKPASANVSVKVFKPLLLNLDPTSPPFMLRVYNFDNSPLEPERVSRLQVQSTFGPTMLFTNRTLSFSTNQISSGVLQIPLPNDIAPSRLWRIQEQ